MYLSSKICEVSAMYAIQLHCTGRRVACTPSNTRRYDREEISPDKHDLRLNYVTLRVTTELCQVLHIDIQYLVPVLGRNT